MESLKKWIWIFGGALLVGFYSTFVMQMLWNWFAVPALNVRSLSYWQMYGLSTLISALLAHVGKEGEMNAKSNWRFAFAVLDACVPSDRMDAVKERLEEITEEMWGGLITTMLGQVVANTITLTLGWTVYTFLA